MTAASGPLRLVVPVFEERARLADYGDELVAYIRDQPPGSELVFVDDGSGDGTPELVVAMLAAHGDVPARLMRRPHAGKGAAVAAGLSDLRTGHGAFCDLDLSTPLADLDRVIDAARRAEVLAIGSRDLSGSTLVRRESRPRETLGRSYNRLLQMTVTPGVVDTQCGAKAASAEVWAALLPFCRQRGFAWDAELVAVAQALGIGVQEVPISWRHDDRSKVNLGRDGAAMVLQTGAIWRSARRATRSGPAGAGQEVDGAAGTPDGHEGDLIRSAGRHWWFRSKAAFVATALARTAGPSGGLLVDAGAGAGGLSATVGWDPDRLFLVEASARLARHARATRGLAVAQGALPSLPVSGQGADVVLLLDVLEHLDDRAGALVEARRVLVEDGRVVVTVPAHPWLWSATDDALGHRCRFRRRHLEELLVDAGFEVVLSTHVFSWLVVPVWIERQVLARGRPALGLERSGPLIDRVALVLTAVERLTIGRLRLPVGSSLLAVGRRQPEFSPPASPRGTRPRR